MTRFVLFALLFFSFHVSRAQEGYTIKGSINGLKDTTVYLGFYQGESTYIKDTTTINSSGEFQFTGKPKLPQGIYFLVLNKSKLPFEIAIGEDQSFSLATDTTNYIPHMKVSGDIDNTLFFDYMRYNMARNKEAEPYVKVLEDSTESDHDKKEAARKAFDKIREKVIGYQQNIIDKHPSTMTARLLKAGMPVNIPDAPRRKDGTVDSTFRLHYYRQHFFDNLDLSDDAMLRLPKPLYKEKITEYLEKLFMPHPDTITEAIKNIVAKAKPNPETYRYMVMNCAFLYQTPEIMGLDEVFVNIYDLYFATGEMDFWANDNLKRNFKQAADRMRLSLIGHKAPNLILKDAEGNMRSMYEMKNKYVIVYIFNPDCWHCKEETPKLVDFINTTKYDIGVYAVSTDSSMTKMENFIQQMNMQKFITTCYYYSAVGHYLNLYDAPSTPSLFLLNRERKIIAKKILPTKIEDFLDHYEMNEMTKQNLSKQ